MPVITDHWEGLEDFFRPGSEILVAREAEDILAAVDLSDTELKRMGRAARERALAEHTAEHRAWQLESALVEAREPVLTGG